MHDQEAIKIDKNNDVLNIAHVRNRTRTRTALTSNKCYQGEV